MYDEHIANNFLSLDTLPKGGEIQEQIQEFLNHKRVIFCTMGKSAYACRKVVYTARSYGLDWYDLDVCHAFHGDAGIVREGDLLVMVSKSGTTRETVDVANYFHKWKRIAVCSDENSELARICDYSIVIPVASEGSPFGYAPMVSTASYMIVLHGILCEAIKGADCTVEEYARNHPGGDIGRRIKNAPDK